MTHPARFSTEIVENVRDLLMARYPADDETVLVPMIWDPFAGTGERLAAMADELGMSYGGTEIEASFIIAEGIKHGDATDWSTYPDVPFVIFTSPAYPNGMSDSWKMSDGSRRYTYRAAIGEIEGEDRQLHDNNQGRYGYRGSPRHSKSAKRAAYWRIARDAVRCWKSARLVLLNVSDFKHSNGHIEPLVQDWRDLLTEFDWTRQTVVPVATKRMRNGANADQRVDIECVIVAER